MGATPHCCGFMIGVGRIGTAVPRQLLIWKWAVKKAGSENDRVK
jgi:hypothetical protein